MSRSQMLGGLGDSGSSITTQIEQVKGIGLPFATLILSAVLSAAAFGIQMVQHAFEMRQANVENGFKFYFDNRTQLKERADADKEMSLLKLIGNAFPNVYCDVRQDVYERSSSAEVGLTAPGSAPFGEADRKNIVSFLVAHDRPASPQFATGVVSVIEASFSSRTGTDAQPCDPLTANAPSAPAGGATVAAATSPAAAPPPAAAPIPEAADKSASAKQKTESAMRASADNTKLSQSQQGPFGPHIYRVYFHIGVSGTKHARPLDIADQFRDELANQQYRVMQGVQLVDTKILPNNPEIRYFGPEEEDAAEKLADYLTEKFKSEKLVFTAKPIGEHFPYMNPDNIEVWLPDPKGAQQQRGSAPPMRNAPPAAG